jgi:DNA-binding GntR family transcriptional regulator
VFIALTGLFSFMIVYIGKQRATLISNGLEDAQIKEKVLQTMKEAGEPLNAGKIAELSGIDRKEVDKAMKQLKEEGAIVSPVRCKWAPAE